MKTIRVYDPPMCCSTGVCGPEVDAKLVAFAAFLKQAEQRGYLVQRYNLSQQPLAFLENSAVKSVLDNEGVEALPLIFVDGAVASKGRYPDQEQRTAWLDSASSVT